MVQFGEVSAWASVCEPLTTENRELNWTNTDGKSHCHLLLSRLGHRLSRD